MSGEVAHTLDACASASDPASSDRSNSRQAFINELKLVHLSGYALCQNAAQDLLPFIGYLDRVKGISEEILYLSKYSMRMLIHTAQDLFPPKQSTDIDTDIVFNELVGNVYLKLYRSCFAVSLLSYLVREVMLTYDINREMTKVANHTIPFLIQAERNIKSLLQNAFSPYRGDILESPEGIFNSLHRRDYTILQNYLKRHGIRGQEREQLIRNIEGLVIGARHASTNTMHNDPRPIRAREIEEIRLILNGWDKDAKHYRGRVFNWIEEKLKDYIPGLMPKHLTSNRALYNTYNKTIARHGAPAWILPTAPDEDEDPVTALARIRAGERARSRRFQAAKRARRRRVQPG